MQQDMYRHIPKLLTGFTGKFHNRKDFTYAGREPNYHLDLRFVEIHYLEIFNTSDFLKNIIFLLYRHECFTGKYTTRKIHKNYIRDPSGLFSIISQVSLSMT